MRNIVGDHRFMIERKDMMVHFQDIYYEPEETEMISSPSGKFNLEIHYYNHEEENRGYNYTKGVITDNSNNLIDTIYRNYSSFPYCWAEAGNDEYLLCGLDYQGYSVVNLSKRMTAHYVPEAWYEGAGFCWADISYLRQERLLAVEGCYWACPYELVIFDFAVPMKLPYKEIFRLPTDKITNLDSWRTEGKIKYIDDEDRDMEFCVSALN